MGAVAFGDLDTEHDLKECLAIVRAGSPAWCRRHDEFESVADEVIASALATYDPSRGPFNRRLIVRSQSRVARMVVRSMPTGRLALVALPEPEVQPAKEPVAADLDAMPAEVAGEAADVEAFLRGLAPEFQDIVVRLYSGMSQAEVATALGIHPRTVSRLVARVQPLAAAYFNRPDLLVA